MKPHQLKKLGENPATNNQGKGFDSNIFSSTLALSSTPVLVFNCNHQGKKKKQKLLPVLTTESY